MQWVCRNIEYNILLNVMELVTVFEIVKIGIISYDRDLCMIQRKCHPFQSLHQPLGQYLGILYGHLYKWCESESMRRSAGS